MINLKSSNSILFSLIFCLSLLGDAEAIFGGNIFTNFNPPETDEKVDQKKQSGSGSRTNCKNPLEENSLSLLVPDSDVAHLTVSDSPTLYFHLEKEVEQFLFVNLVIPKAGVDNPIFGKRIKVNKAGIHKVSLPTTVKLKFNELYLWQIGISCQNDPQRASQVLSAGIKRVSLPPDSEKLFIQSEDVNSKVAVLSGHGIWYDAIDLVSKSDTYSAIEIVESTNLVVSKN